MMMKTFLLLSALLLVFQSANAADTPCVTSDDKPLPFKIYFRERNHIVPEFNSGQWDHVYAEDIATGMARMTETIADYQDCLASHFYKKDKSK